MLFLSYLNLRRLSIPKISPIDLIVLASYYLFVLLFFLSLLGFFKKEFIASGLAVGFFVFLGLFWKKIEWRRHYLYFFILIPILFTGILLIKGYFEGMGMNSLLPWAREMVLQGRMIDSFDAISVGIGVTSRAPLMPLFYAGAFSLFGFSHWVIAILPFFFSSATVLLLYIWLSDKGVKKSYIIFGILLLLANPLFLSIAMHPLQEPFILFFFTAFFYYIERFQGKGGYFSFLLLFLSAVLAFASKEPGIVLFLPLGWVFIKSLKNRQLSRKFLFYSLLAAFPLFLWLLRNYIVFDNPVSPFLNGIFKGRFYDVISVVQQNLSPMSSVWSGNIFSSVAGIFSYLFLYFFPLAIISFYGFWKKRKIQYVFPFLLLLSIVLFVEPDVSGGFSRYVLPFLAIFLVYAVVGLQEIKSRTFFSFIFFINFLGLFSTKLLLSKSQFLVSFEENLSGLRVLSQFIYDYRLIASLILSVFFFFFISRHKPHYLILLIGCIYLVKAEVFHLGSWLNIWLPILSIIFITLTWRLIIKLKDGILLWLISGYIIVLLIFNGWGLALAYALTHGGFIFPNSAEAYEFRPEMASEIEKIEGKNKDFYILADNPTYFTWYRNFKMAKLKSHSLYLATNLEYNDSLSSPEIYNLFKKSKIRYVLESGRYDNDSRVSIFYDKIKNQPDLFEPIFRKGEIYLWRVK